MPPFRRLHVEAKRWGTWFTPIGEGGVKQTNLNIFYFLGEALGEIEKLEAGVVASANWIYLQHPNDYLLRFLNETEGINLPDSRKAAEQLSDVFYKIICRAREDVTYVLSPTDITQIIEGADKFERCLEREYRYLDVFTVTPKGIYDTRLLMTKPEDKFPERVRRHLPKQSLDDIKQAARCLAFDIPTACAFHICRATESLMLAYYEVLSGKPWALTNRNWKVYIDHLVVHGAVKTITDRLGEIKDTDRNAYTHPERNVTLEEAPIQFELCTGVMFQMADEICKKKTQ